MRRYCVVVDCLLFSHLWRWASADLPVGILELSLEMLNGQVAPFVVTFDHVLLLCWRENRRPTSPLLGAQ